jgi:hypothetical protein
MDMRNCVVSGNLNEDAMLFASYATCVRFEVFMAVTVKNALFPGCGAV